MLDPRTILISIPCYDGRIMTETCGALASCQGLYAAHSLPTECSHISLVRNLIAASFLASSFEWLVCVDSDIAFSRTDLELLLEPTDARATYVEADSHEPGTARPTRIGVSQPLDAAHLESKTVSAADVLVVAEYSFKNDLLEPCKFGMGFVRIHRSVFERLQALKHDGGPTVEVRRDLLENLGALASSDEAKMMHFEQWRLQVLGGIQALLSTRDDTAGQPRLWQSSWKGRLYTDFFPSGPIVSQFVPTAEWKGEDHGFFTLCRLAGIIPRVETRTRLVHIGRKGYPYLGPDVGGGQ